MMEVFGVGTCLRRKEGERNRIESCCPPASRSMSSASSLCVDEGALSFVTTISAFYRDSPCEREWGRHNDRRPSSKQAAEASGKLGLSTTCLGPGGGVIFSQPPCALNIHS